MRPPPIFWVFNSPSPRPPGADRHHRGRGNVGRHCAYTNNIWCGYVQALLRYRSKTAKMQKFPIDSHSNENFICLFFRPPGGRQPPKGEKTRPDPGYARMQNMAWIEIQDGGRRHLGFSVYVNLAIPACWQCCYVPNLVQIPALVTEIDAHMPQTSIWWRHAKLLTVSTFGHVVISAWPWCIFPWNLAQSGVIDIFSKIEDSGGRHLGLAWVSHGTTHEASFVVRTSCKILSWSDRWFSSY